MQYIFYKILAVFESNAARSIRIEVRAYDHVDLKAR